MRKINIQITQKEQFFDFNDYDFRIPHVFYHSKLKKINRMGDWNLNLVEDRGDVCFTESIVANSYVISVKIFFSTVVPV